MEASDQRLSLHKSASLAILVKRRARALTRGALIPWAGQVA